MIKKIGIVGRARVGKSLLCSRFCEDSNLIKNHFAADGGDFTKVNVQYVINKELSKEQQSIRFISPNSSLNGIRYPLTEDGLNKFEEQIFKNNTYSKQIEDKAGQRKDLDPKNDIIEIHTRPSELVLNIMGIKLNGLIITDTPGVSGNVEGLENINDADLYVFMMRSDNLSEYEKSVKKMEPIIGGARVLFIYNIRDEISDETDYKETLETTFKAMKDFEEKLAILRSNSIIENSIELLNPLNSVIPMGNFHKKRINFAEFTFNHELAQKLKSMLEVPLYKQEENILNAELHNCINNKNTIIEFTKNVIDAIPLDISKGVNTYKEKFLKIELHDRVMSRDNYRIRDAVNSNKGALLTKIHEYFDKLKVNVDYTDMIPKHLQEIIIKYIYSRLTLSVKKDCGISLGHHFESNPPTTMWAQEAILAQELLGANATNNSILYTSVFKNNGISSSSWNSVRLINSSHEEHGDFCNEKLKIIVKAELDSLESNNIKELVFNSYNLSLFLVGKLAIFNFFVESLEIEVDLIDFIGDTITLSSTF